ncbi:MAG: hypothetical protein ACLUUO_12505 [Sellimonas intestinalis]
MILHTSEIVRYCVYVESDYDMDGDGKRDLIKVLVQVPRSAAEGNYKAASLFEARPYCAGVQKTVTNHYERSCGQIKIPRNLILQIWTKRFQRVSRQDRSAPWSLH